jgi:hypothetical protein
VLPDSNDVNKTITSDHYDGDGHNDDSHDHHDTYSYEVVMYSNIHDDDDDANHNTSTHIVADDIASSSSSVSSASTG